MEATFGKLQSETTLWLKCGFYNPHNLNFLLLWLQSGLCGLFEPQIIWILATYNPHFIIRSTVMFSIHNVIVFYVNLFK